MEDEKVPVTLFVPKSVKDEIDKLVNQPLSPFSSRSHAWVQIFYQWKQANQKPSKKAPTHMYEAM